MGNTPEDKDFNQWKFIVEHASIGVIIIGENREIIYINPVLTDWLGYNREDVYKIKDFIYFVFPEDRELLMQRYEKRLAGKAITNRYSFRLLNASGKAIWVEVAASRIKWDGHYAILGYITDITKRVQALKNLKGKVIEIKELLTGAVYSLSAAIEKRDPYTAGHQKRVAVLSREIAIRMGMPQHQIDGLYLSALVHDIGKIYIPAEILNRPGRVTDIEMAMIKTHPEVGYEILKVIDFDWPIAEIVLQHHERIDGSGYPFHLKQDEILLEARIIGLADVVEAIASHRPYRPSLGIDTALDLIERKKGVLFDPDIVDICVRLFRKEGFELPERPALITRYSIKENE